MVMSDTPRSMAKRRAIRSSVLGVPKPTQSSFLRMAGVAFDPEEMLVAPLSDCHMLSFLHVARLARFTVAAYRDHAEGVMDLKQSGTP